MAARKVLARFSQHYWKPVANAHQFVIPRSVASLRSHPTTVRRAPDKFQARELDNAPIAPSAKVGFGQYKDLTYAEVVSKDPAYCDWLLNKLIDPEQRVFYLPWMKFVVYYLSRNHQAAPSQSKPALIAVPPVAPEVTTASTPAPQNPLSTPAHATSAPPPHLAGDAVVGHPACLATADAQPMLFVVTGEAFGGVWSQTAVKELLEFYGGAVRSAVSRKTHYVVVGEEKKSKWSKHNETNVSTHPSRKEKAAQEHRIPSLNFAGLLDLIQQRSAGTDKGTWICFRLDPEKHS